MSRWPDRIVRLAARTLPPTIRDRYREEWTGDVADARDAGIRPSSVAVGAMVFSATLDRDAPEISGVPASVAVVRRARWGVSLLAVAAVLSFGGFYVAAADIGDAPRFPAVATFVTAVGGLWAWLAVAVSVLAIMQLWRAAIAWSTLSKVSAGLATTCVASAMIGIAVPHVGAGAVVLTLGSAIAALVAGAIAWTSNPADSLRTRSESVVEPSRVRATWMVLALSVLLAAAVLVGALDLLVWSPQWQAPGYSVTEIVSALTSAGEGGSFASAIGWVIVCSFAVFVFFIAGIVNSARKRPRSVHNLVVVTFAMISIMVVMQFVAGFSVGMAIADNIPPYRGGRSEVGVLYGVIGQLALIGAILMTATPRPRVVAEPAKAT